MEKRELLEKIEALQNMLVAFSTGGNAESEEYRALREELLREPTIRSSLPRFVVTCRDLSQFWEFIKGEFAHYQERREYIWGEFAPVIEKLELELLDASPVDHLVAGTLDQPGVEHVQEVWTRALERRVNDPGGAITLARTLLESVCKSLLGEMGIEYSESADLPNLYRLIAKRLNLAPGQHTEKVFQQILGGCQSVVEGLGGVRNRLGDAHGQGRQPVRPAPRHAELAVNLAGAMALFLIRTWRFHKDKGAGEDLAPADAAFGGAAERHPVRQTGQPKGGTR
jgi:hypothetical protein